VLPIQLSPNINILNERYRKHAQSITKIAISWKCHIISLWTFVTYRCYTVYCKYNLYSSLIFTLLWCSKPGGSQHGITEIILFVGMFFESQSLMGVLLFSPLCLAHIFTHTDFFQVFEVFWVRLYHMENCVWHKKKFLFSYFIMFIFHWRCLFPCDTHTGLLAWLWRIKWFSIATFKTKWKIYFNPFLVVSPILWYSLSWVVKSALPMLLV
jgi:hypothetical protein